MSDIVYTCGGVELREASGETYSTVVHDGTLTIKRGTSGAVSIDVDGQAVEWVATAPNGPFKQVDTRNYMIATNDLMSYFYLTLPKGLPDTKYEHLHAVLTAIKDGQPIPSAPGAALPAAPQPSTTPAATGSATPAANPMGDLLKAVAGKAAHDTLMLGKMIQQKAEHDMKQFQDHPGQPKPT